MRSDVRALIWEECRVGGILAAACLVFGVIFLFEAREMWGPHAWERDSMSLIASVIGTPLLVSLLLILNPNYSGHLAGGFSVRVLLLPVPTRTAVACALVSRSVFVGFVSLFLVGLSQIVFDTAPDWTIVCLIVIFYLLAQTIDWLREFASGFSSLIVLFALAVVVFLLLGPAELSDLRFAATPSSASLPIASFALAAVAAIAYTTSVFTVTATRAGKHVGIPEIWEWPRRVSISRPAAARPFRSPVGAQVWFELRRTFWFLPVWTFVLTVFILVIVWFYRKEGEIWLSGYLSGIASYLIFVAFLGVAIVQGIRSRILGFRSTSGDPGYDHLQPMTPAQLVSARTIASVIALVPTFLFIALLHFGLTAGAYFFALVSGPTVSEAYSMREVVWAVFSRSILIGLGAWAFLAVGTRMFRWSVPVVLALLFMIGLYADWANRGFVPIETFLIFASSILAVVTIATFVYVVKQGLISTRSAVLWGVAWVLSTWVLYQTAVFASAGHNLSFVWHATALLVCWGWAAFVPLPYFAALTDTRLRRHSATPSQGLVSGGGPLAAGGRDRTLKLAQAAAVVTAVFLLWITMPSTPAFERYWRSLGYPTDLEALNAWYPEVSPEENIAEEYLSIVQEHARLSAEFWQPRNAVSDHEVRVLIVDGPAPERAEQLPEDSWNFTERYWREVTAYAAPELKNLAAKSGSRSRYPIDLSDGMHVELSHLAQLRGLARELHVDALHWAIAGKPREAIESALAILPIANSISEEPVLISQLVRIAIYGVSIEAIEDVLNRSIPAEADLSQVQNAFASALPPPDEQLIVNRGMIGDIAMGLDYRYMTLLGGNDPDRKVVRPTSIASSFMYPASLERLVRATYFDNVRRRFATPREEFQRGYDGLNDEKRFERTQFMSPIAAILFSPYARIYEGEWRIRMQFDVARAALAVERYRLAMGVLPESLNDLVPKFLPEVPEDYYTGVGEPIRYRRHEDFGFVVYSVGRDMEDDRGVEMEKWSTEGDFTFTVAPLAFRTGPQIQPRTSHD